MILKKKNKIYFVLPSLCGGGAEKAATIILNHIDRDSFCPNLILFNKSGEYLNDIANDVKIFGLNKKNRWDFFRLIFRLRQIIKKQRPDIAISFLEYQTVSK